MKENTTWRNRLTEIGRTRIILYFIAILGTIVYLLPLYSGAMTSIKTVEAFAQTLPTVPPNPSNIVFSPWITAGEILAPSMINSILFTIPATLLSVTLGSLAAYGLTMVNWRGQVGLMALFVAATFLPKQAIIVPLSRFWAIVDLQMLLSNIGPFDLFALPWIQPYHATIIELIVTHTAYGISISTLLFRGYYLTIDDQLMDAAKIDGAGILSIYRNIILPLSYPMFAVVCIFQFTQIWNEFLYGLVLTAGGDAAPATVALNNLNSGFAQLYNRQMAGAFVVALPTLLVYLLFGDQFVKGVQY